MEQKLIKIGNSLGVIIPQTLRKNTSLKVGDTVLVEKDSEGEMFLIRTKKGSKKNKKEDALDPAFLTWLEKFNARYKKALTELANK